MTIGKGSKRSRGGVLTQFQLDEMGKEAAKVTERELKKEPWKKLYEEQGNKFTKLQAQQYQNVLDSIERDKALEKMTPQQRRAHQTMLDKRLRRKQQMMYELPGKRRQMFMEIQKVDEKYHDIFMDNGGLSDDDKFDYLDEIHDIVIKSAMGDRLHAHKMLGKWAEEYKERQLRKAQPKKFIYHRE